MSTLGERIKYARETKGFLQSELAKLIGVKSSGVISNWEKDLNKPDAEKIVKLCDVLDISASFLLDYYGKSTFEAKPSEQNMIEQYRSLDPHGKDMVDTVLEKEVERMAKPNSSTELTVEEAEAVYIKSRSSSARKKGLSASNTTEDIEPNRRNEAI